MATLTALVDIRADLRFDAGATGGTGAVADFALPIRFEAHVDLIPAPKVPPVVPVFWQRVSETYPDPTSMLLIYDRPDPETFKPSSTVRSTFGRPFVRVGGYDLTYWRGVPVEVESWSESEPWGWQQATLVWPHGTLLTTSDDLEIRPGVSVDIGLADQNSVFLRWLWRGLCATAERTEDSVRIEAVGLLRQTRAACHQPPFWPTLADSGRVVADAMNGVVSRRFGATQRVTTGIETATRGSRSDTVEAFVAGTLALMTTDDGTGQWTLMPTDTGVPVLRLKNRTTQHWTVTAGQRGVRCELTEDFVDFNVIYGSGVDGTTRWDNARFPGSNPNIAPPFPNSNPGNTIHQGESDRNTDNGTGVTQIQTKLKSLGYSCPVDGAYGSSTTKAVRAFQRNAGIQIDGIVAGQTWGALWPVTGILGTPLFLPLAARDDVMPFTYKADGTVTGSNSHYNPQALRVERYVAFGEGVTRDRAQAWSAAQIRRHEQTPNVSGTITLTADPREGHRRAVRAGHNIRVRGYAGTASGILLHIVGVEHSDSSTELTVDARARDALELAALVARDRAAVDPALRILQARQSTTGPDMSPWSAEAPAGIVPARALYRRLWSCFQVPVGRWGSIVRTQFFTSPKAAYAVIVFSRKVTSNQVLSIVGDPLSESSNGFGRIANEEEALTKLGMLIGWGQSGQSMGFEPAETSSSGGTGTLTGTFDEQSSWDFASQDGVNLTVAVYADRSTRISGRFYVALPVAD